MLLVGVVAGLLFAGDGPPPTTQPPLTTTTTAATTTSAPPTTVATTTSTTQPATAEEMVFTASEDTVIDNQSPDTSFGDAPVLEVEQEGVDTKRALLRFEVTGVPDGAVVTQATLRLFQIDASEEGALVSLVDGEWSEDETTWATAPPVGAPLTPIAGGAPGSVIEIDVTAAVSGNGPVDLYITTDSDDGVDFASSEGTQSPPTLTLSVTGSAGTSPSGRMVLVGAGDIASCSSDGDELTAALVEEAIADADQAVVFTAGDNAYESGSAESFANCYHPSWGRFKDITRPAPGSREYRTPGASAYFAYFGAAAGDPTEGWYSYNFAGWHVVVINSNCTEIGGCEAGSPQEQWLRQDLAAHSTACTIAYWHQPLFSSRSGGTNPEMLPIFTALDEADADIVVNANDHFYERFLPQEPDGNDDEDGIVQFTVGTGGRSLDDFLGPSSNSATRFNEAYGVLALTLHPGGYDWDFVTPEGTPFTDRGTGTCH